MSRQKTGRVAMVAEASTATHLLTGVLEYHVARPVEFVHDWFGANPEPEQCKMLEGLVTHNRVAIRSGHGVGKTACLAWAILWWMCTHYRCRVPCTAPTQHQLDDILWPEIAKWLRGSALAQFVEWTKTRLWVKGYDEEWFAVPQSCSKPENLQGFHGDSVLFVVDEAAGVDESIWPVIMGALSTEGSKLVMAGNPTRTAGTFFDAFHKDRALYYSHRFSSEESKLVSPEFITDVARRYGRDSNVYRVRVLGAFPTAEPDTLMPLDLVESAVERKVAGGDKIEIGVDPARYGDDESVVAWRVGNRIMPVLGFHGINTVRLTGEIVRLVRDIRDEYPDYGGISVKVDDTGVGGGVTDQLEDQADALNIDVVPVNNGDAGDDEYTDYGSRLWCEFKQALGEVSLPDDPDLIAQLSTRKYSVRPDGRIKIERKEDMKKRGLRSPDRADAVVLALAQGARVTISVA